MNRHPMRSFSGLLALAGLALMLGCSKPDQAPPPAAALSPEQVQQLQQRVADLGGRVARLNDQLAEMQRQQFASLASLTSESQSLTAQINDLGGQIGVKPVPLGPRVPLPGARPANGAAAAPKSADEHAKGAISPLMRLLLIVIALFALWIMVRIFLGRMSEEEEDEDEFFADSFDEEQVTEEGTIRLSPEVQASVSPAAEVKEPPKEEPAPEADKPQ